MPAVADMARGTHGVAARVFLGQRLCFHSEHTKCCQHNFLMQDFFDGPALMSCPESQEVMLARTYKAPGLDCPVSEAPGR